MAIEAAPSARGFIRSHKAFARLWTARTVSFLGDSVGLVALLLYVANDTGSALAVAMLMLVGDFAPQLLSPIAGAIADRVDRRLVMIACEIGQALAVLAIAITLPPLPVLLILVALRSVLATVFQPASRAAVPSLVADAHLPRANSLIGAGTHGLDVLGPLVAAALLPVLHIRGLLLFDAATFAVSALLLVTLPRLPRPVREVPTTVLGDAAEGLRYLWRHKVIRVVALGFCAIVAFNGVDDVALVFLAKDALQQGDSAASVLYAGVGAGLMVGFAVVARWSGRVPMVVLLLIGYGVSSLGNLLTGLAWALVAAFGMQFVRGAGIAATDTAHNTLIQRVVPEPLLGRVFGNLYGAVGVAAGLSYVLGGLVLDATGPRFTLIAAGAGGLLVTVVVAAVLPGRLRSEAVHLGPSAQPVP
ncbi:MFS transporter [Rhizocola hellebori]|uniref:MFS transporter n=1 Tax=Rhizocola hellebori TaxID=1392758 RepID=UPI0019450B29|nr:MFS transporter [Rhizocola hellebori]